ncbi:MAG: hypothetical protein FRX49_03937 [Trebouxia sp. A1-2]|nr:MAG: hypothetical protein FRX49_03937 [Trebouxia sp. A1-2]
MSDLCQASLDACLVAAAALFLLAGCLALLQSGNPALNLFAAAFLKPMLPVKSGEQRATNNVAKTESFRLTLVGKPYTTSTMSQGLPLCCKDANQLASVNMG